LTKIVRQHSNGPSQLAQARLGVFDLEPVSRYFRQGAIANRKHHGRHEKPNEQLD
jgi:hypothetical protein